MWKLNITILFALVGSALHAQPGSPGGVDKPIYWLLTDTAIKGIAFTNKGRDSLNMTIHGSSAGVGSFNFHPSVLLRKNNWLLTNVNTKLSIASTVFSVYYPTDTTAESSIWHFTRKRRASLVITTDRVADLDSYDYMNYNHRNRKHPKLNIYAQQKSPSPADSSSLFWQIGSVPANPTLPVKAYEGLLPEIIAYDRVLNAEERLKVGSYLALKYGITLAEPSAQYLSSSGRIIWEGGDYKTFHHNIAGIGRDDSSSLLQPAAASSNQARLLKVETFDALKNEAFLIWGDNDKPMTEADTEQASPHTLNKNWFFVNTGTTVPWKTALTIDSKQIDIDPLKNIVYWIAIDRSGKSKTTGAEVDYYRMTTMDTERNIIFRDVTWNKTGNQQESMHLIPGGELLLSAVLDKPTCSTAQKGKITMEIHGGFPPYSIDVITRSGLDIRSINNAGTEKKIADNLPAGKTTLRVKDLAGNIYLDSFYVNNADGPAENKLLNSYIIPASGLLRLDGSAEFCTGCVYSWSGPGAFQSPSPAIDISKPGQYLLATSYNGCTGYKEIDITSAIDNLNAGKITLFPNPSMGNFSVIVVLDYAAPVILQVFTATGQLLHTQKKQGLSNYTFNQRIEQNGTYQVVITSGQKSITKSLLILK